MDPKNFQTLLIVSFCSLILFNPAHAVCVKRKSEQLHPSPLPSSTPTAAPVSAPIPSLRSQPIPFSSPTAAPVSAPIPSLESQSVPSSSPTAAPVSPPNATPVSDPIPSESIPSSSPNAAPVSDPIPSESTPFSSPNAAPPTSHISAPTPSADPPSKSTSYPHTGMLKQSSHSNLFEPIVHPISSSTTGHPDMKKICDSTDYPAVCLASITPLFTGKIDPVSALEMAIKAASAHTKLALLAATNFASSPLTPASTASILSDCRDSYADALDNFQSALDAIPDRDMGTINSMLSAVVTDVVTCADGFAGGVSLLDSFDDKLTKMGSNCLAIASLIK